jgi:hypothetical protein
MQGDAVNKILATVLAIFPLPALATLPAGEAQVFCTGNVVGVARVQSATSNDCRLYYAGQCSPANGVRLSIVVNEVLAVSKDNPPLTVDGVPLTPSRVLDLIGKTLEVSMSAHNQHFLTADDDASAPDNGGYLVAPTSDPLTDADVRRLYVGESFVFSLVPSLEPGSQPQWGTVWPLKSRAWLVKTLQQWAGKDCPAPLGQ